MKRFLVAMASFARNVRLQLGFENSFASHGAGHADTRPKRRTLHGLP